jgi:hypothetical protein
MIFNIITIAESNQFLALHEDWLDLSDEEKTFHISRACSYVQVKWVCANVNWSDSLTVPSNVKMAIAHYAYADFKGSLYGEPGSDEVSGRIKSYSNRVGLLSDSKVYSGSMPGNLKSLGYPDLLMSASCVSASTGMVRS